MPALLPLVLSGRLQRLGVNSNRLSSEAVQQLRDAVKQAAQAAGGEQRLPGDDPLGSLSDNEEPDDDDDEAEDDDADVVVEAQQAEAADEAEDADAQVEALADELDSLGKTAA